MKFITALLMLAWSAYPSVLTHTNPFLALTDGKDTTVSAFDVPPKPISQAPVVYPDAAKKDRIEGTVIVMVTIDAGGKVSDVSLKKGVRADIDKAALTSARAWTFEPAQRDNKPVEATVAIPFNFKLDGDKGAKEPGNKASDHSAPKLMNKVEPYYPEKALEAGVEGTVYVEMTIDAKGAVIDARVIKGGHELLNESAVSTVRKWKFESTGREKSTVVAPIRYKLSKDKK